jgi:hypothetical protein
MVLGFVHLNLVKCFTFDRLSLFWPLGLRKVGCLDMDLCLGTLFEIAPPLEVVITTKGTTIAHISMRSIVCGLDNYIGESSLTNFTIVSILLASLGGLTP